MTNLIDKLNDPSAEIRLDSLRQLMDLINQGKIERPITGNDVNNHIHTSYSFSPYSPTKALWMAYNAGLKTAGIMDHDSLSGAKEFIEAGKIIGLMTTIGVECRADMSSTRLNGLRINNPDQKSVAYMALHGIPHQNIDRVIDFFKPYSANRNKRNRLMTKNINKIMEAHGISLDFDKDILPLSMAHEYGSVTERHLLFALSLKIADRFGKGGKVVNLLKEKINMDISPSVERLLLDKENPFYEYDLLGALKSNMVEKFYIDASDECPKVDDVISFGKKIGAISAYAYLGDVGNSVTGDKKTQKFEDDYIDLLFDVLNELNFNAVTYMPSRNTDKQLEVIRSLCDKYNLFQISGEDINSPRQSFIIEAQRRPEFANLYDATLALINHENLASKSLEDGMFSSKNISKYPNIKDRIKAFK